MNLMAPQQGWQCPVCQRVYAPMTHMCFYCPPKINTAPNTAPSTDGACSIELRMDNKPYPRTCTECGLGPCKRGKQ